MRRASIEPGYFDALYARDADPWRFETSAYEREKYAATLAALPRRSYGAALEVGCSIGVFTLALSTRCGRLLALDCAEAALTRARARCADARNVAFRRARVPQDWPDDETFDLVILSELVYFFDRANVARLAEKVGASLRPGGHCALVHWLGETDYPLSGDDAVTAFLEASRSFASPLSARREAAYRLDLIARRAGE